MHRSSEVKHVASDFNTRGCECFGQPPVQPFESHCPVLTDRTVRVQLKESKVKDGSVFLFTFFKFKHRFCVSVHLRSESSLTALEWLQTASSIRWTPSVRLRWRKPSNSRRRSLWRRLWPSAVVLSRFRSEVLKFADDSSWWRMLTLNFVAEGH